MPRFSPYAALQILVARRCGTPLVVVTRAIGEEAAVHVLRCGAKDYLTKDKLGTLPQIIERVMTERQRVLEQERLGRESRPLPPLKKLSARVVVVEASAADLARTARPAGPDTHRHGDSLRGRRAPIRRGQTIPTRP
jgi:DNA-binding NtrC family response regulator